MFSCLRNCAGGSVFPTALQETSAAGSGAFAATFKSQIEQRRCQLPAIDIAPVVGLRNNGRGLVSDQPGLKPITIESGPSNGSTRVDTKPASRIQAWQSAPV